MIKVENGEGEPTGIKIHFVSCLCIVFSYGNGLTLFIVYYLFYVCKTEKNFLLKAFSSPSIFRTIFRFIEN